MFKTIYAVGVLANYIIGVGMFSLPYITSQVGIGTMLGYFLFLVFFVVLVNLFYGELALRTPDKKRLPGFAKIYLGNFGEKIAAVATILSLYGAILAYLIVGGEFLHNLLSPIFGGGNLIYVLLYFSAGAIMIFFGRKLIFQIEFFGLILFIAILFFIFWRGLPLFRIDNLFAGAGVRDLFLPFGPLLFSLWGLEIIPEIEEILGKGKSSFKKIICLGSLLPSLIYIFFIFLVLGISGPQTTETAIPGLQNFLGKEVIFMAFLLGIITTFTSFNSLGLNLRSVFWYDLKINKNLAWVFTCFVPLTLFLIGVQDFIFVISFVGGITMLVTGILVLLMYQKLPYKNQNSKVKELLIYPLLVMFLLGIVYEIIYFAR